MKLFELFAKIIVDKSTAEDDLNKFSDEAEKASKKVDDSFGKTASFGLETVGKGLVTVGNGLSKYITKPALIAGSAMAGITLKKGWDRMTSIDNAKVKLGALGNSAKDVRNIMNNALASVKGTSYGLDEAATTAASAVASGVQAGKPLEKYLTNVADLAAVAGTSMGDMGYIMNKVQASGKATNQELGMLAERGLPVYEWLGKEAGKTADEIFNMASKGQISSEMLQNAIEKNIGGAAKEIGSKTISGAIANFGASLSRVGSNFLGSADDANSFAGKVLPILNSAMDKMGGVEESAKRWGKVAGEVFGAIVQYFKDGKVDTDKLSESGKTLFSEIKPILSIVKLIGKAFGNMSTEGKIHFATAAIAAGPLLKATGKVAGKMSSTYKWYKKNETQIKALGNAAKKGGKTIGSAMGKVSQLAKSGSVKIAEWCKTGAVQLGKAGKAAMQYGGKLLQLAKSSKIAAFAHKLFTGALIPLPILIIIGVISALIAIFVVLWNKSEKFRNFWKGLWKSIKDATSEAWKAIKKYVLDAMHKIQDVISAVWTVIKNIWKKYGDDIKKIVKTIFNGIKTYISGVMQVIKGIIKVVTSLIKGDWKGVWTGIKQITSGVWTAIKGVIQATTAQIKFVISAVLKVIKSIFGGTWKSIKTTTTSIWNGIKKAITTPINAAVNAVKKGINKIKNLFNFKFKWPHIPLPHFKISGSANPLKWLKGHKPKISVDWYAKGGILTKPTIFGQNGNNLMGGGEAGPEAVAPITELRKYIQGSVDTKRLEDKLDQMISLLNELISVTGSDIVLSDGTVVGHYAPLLDEALGKISERKARG